MNTNRSYYNFLISSFAVICAFVLSANAIAADFSNKRIEWIIPFKEGGGSDTWARYYAPMLAKNLPGEPVIAVKNVPGGGSTTGANQFQSRAKPNGLTLLGTSGSTQFPYLLGDKRANYEYKDWKVVLATPTGGVAYINPDLGTDIAKLKSEKLVYGSQGATSLDLIPLLAFEKLGLNVKAVFGMKGRGAGRLAFERGETNIDYQTSSSFLKKVTPLVEAGKATPLMSWGALDADGNLVRDPTFPDLPHFAELYETVHGEAPSGEWFNAWKAFYAAGFAAQKMIFLPNDTPDDIVQAWRDAAAAVVESDEFKNTSQAALGEYPQAVGDAADGLVDLAINVDSQAVEWVRTWLTERYNVKF